MEYGAVMRGSIMVAVRFFFFRFCWLLMIFPSPAVLYWMADQHPSD